MPPSRRTPAHMDPPACKSAVALPTASSTYATVCTLAPEASSLSTRAPFSSIRGARDQDQDQGSHIKSGLIMHHDCARVLISQRPSMHTQAYSTVGLHSNSTQLHPGQGRTHAIPRVAGTALHRTAPPASGTQRSPAWRLHHATRAALSCTLSTIVGAE